VVEILHSITVEAVVPVVDKVFSTFGYPKVVKTDNGPQFTSALWNWFTTSCGITHRRITPYWPKANAQAENFNRPMMKAIRAAHVEHRNWKQELYKFLRMFRSTPHCTTQFSPYFLLFGREARTKLPEIQSYTHPADDQVRARDADAKKKMKTAADTRVHAKASNIVPGDKVLLKQVKKNKLSTNFNPTPLVVTSTKGSMITAKSPAGSSVTRNSSLFRRLPESLSLPATPDENVDPIPDEHPANQAAIPPLITDPPIPGKCSECI
jgi:hypothetical protein